MIRFFIKNGNDSLKFDMPTDELFDHLGSIGINEDIPITCSEKIYLDFYPTYDWEKTAECICERLSESDKISDVNKLCFKIEGAKIDSEQLVDSLDVMDAHGVKEIGEIVEYLEIQNGQSMKDIGM